MHLVSNLTVLSWEIRLSSFSLRVCLFVNLDGWDDNIYRRLVKLNEIMIAKSLVKYAAAAAAKSRQSCPTLCDPIDGSPPCSAVPGILQARILEWVAIAFSNAWKWKVKVKSLSRVRLLATPWIAAHQAPPSMGFSKQEYWSGVPNSQQPSINHPKAQDSKGSVLN